MILFFVDYIARENKVIRDILEKWSLRIHRNVKLETGHCGELPVGQVVF